jgi:hypothetical protein
MEETEQSIQELKDRIRAKTSSMTLTMNRVPKNTYDRFIALANQEDFCSDFGMTLKFLLDFYIGIIPTGLETMQMDILMLKDKVGQLESRSQAKPEPETKVVRMANGRVI